MTNANGVTHTHFIPAALFVQVSGVFAWLRLTVVYCYVSACRIAHTPLTCTNRATLTIVAALVNSNLIVIQTPMPFRPTQPSSAAECVAACAATNFYYSKTRAAVGLAPRRRPARTGLEPVRIARLLGMLRFSRRRGLFAPALLDFPRRRTVKAVSPR